MRHGARDPSKTRSNRSVFVERDDLPTTTTGCIANYKNFPYEPGVEYCNVTFDNFLCWPPTPVGYAAYQGCPPIHLGNEKGLAFRECGEDGAWRGRYEYNSGPLGWTNFTDCYDPDAREMIEKVYAKDTEEKLSIVQHTRYLEIAGFSTSLLALLICLVIFWNYRSLRNNRTRIHKNLFLAMVIQVVIRLTLYIDQAIIRSLLGDYTLYKNVSVRGIDNMPYLCESFYVLLEYGNTAMFMWMLVEGLYLQKMVTASALHDDASYGMYYAIGWGLPVLVTSAWTAANAAYFGHESTCWWGYNFSVYYWILQGPRLAVIIANLVFLLNVIRVLVEKMKHTNTSEMEKIKKAVRAAIVLLPLLGITNLLTMTAPPLDKSVWQFALWCYCVHFLNSFQGFFIAMIYCFMNGEVRTVLKKSLDNYLAMRQANLFFFLNSNSDTLRSSRKSRRDGQETSTKRTWFRMKKLSKHESTNNASNSDQPPTGPPSDENI